MKLLIFGATGGTGTCLVDQALQRGHEVTVCVRDPARLTLTAAARADGCAIVRGDMLDATSLAQAFSQPHDAVISALGIYSSKPSTALSTGTANILDAMAVNGISRLGVVSSLGVGNSRGQGNLFARLIQRTILRHTLADKERQEALIMASELDWTIIRPPQLTDDERIHNGAIVWTAEPPTTPRLSWKLSRASVAALLLDAIEQQRYRRTAVNVTAPA